MKNDKKVLCESTAELNDELVSSTNNWKEQKIIRKIHDVHDTSDPTYFPAEIRIGLHISYADETCSNFHHLKDLTPEEYDMAANGMKIIFSKVYQQRSNDLNSYPIPYSITIERLIANHWVSMIVNNKVIVEQSFIDDIPVGSPKVSKYPPTTGGIKQRFNNIHF